LSTEPDPDEPTAQQSVVFKHDTEFNTARVVPLGLGLAMTDHVVPLNLSTRVCETDPVTEKPTATQVAAAAHETPARADRSTPATLGLVTADQIVPFQCSINVVEKRVAPTAKQLVGLPHETELSPPSGGPAGFGLVETDHAGAAPAGTAAATITPATSAAEAMRQTNDRPTERRADPRRPASRPMPIPPLRPHRSRHRKTTFSRGQATDATAAGQSRTRRRQPQVLPPPAAATAISGTRGT
jgi:hypothetical protein